MKLVRLLLFLLSIAAAGSLSAQDVHNSLFNMSPLTLNPANTGAFFGTARVGGIYRGQWWSVSSNRGYETPSFYIDAPIIRGFRDQDWVGVGAVIVNDVAGTLNLRTNSSAIGASYHYGLDKKGEDVLTLGVQVGRVQRSFNQDRALLGDEYDPVTGAFTLQTDDAVLAGANARDLNYLDIRAGLLYKSKIDDFDTFEAGISFGRINQPEYLFGNATPTSGNDTISLDFENRPMLFTVHSRYEFALNESWSLAPTALYQTTGSASELNVQAWAGLKLKDIDPQEDVRLNFGLGYRVGDAAEILLGMDYGPLRVAASFDVNTSMYNVATDYQGAFEVAAYYIFKIYKEPSIKPAILCPKF